MCMDKPKNKNNYYGKAIYSSDTNRYVAAAYGEDFYLDKTKLIKIKPFLQKDYGGTGDCTLTAILTVVKYYKPELDTNEVYNYIEKIAKKYLYTEFFGTFFSFNKPIMKNVFKHFNINKNIYSKYLKDIGFNTNDMINQLDKNIPIIISIMNDGRNFYTGHTITIMGYRIYKSKINDKIKFLFAVYDNWSRTICYLDYQLLRKDCVICY